MQYIKVGFSKRIVLVFWIASLFFSGSGQETGVSHQTFFPDEEIEVNRVTDTLFQEAVQSYCLVKIPYESMGTEYIATLAFDDSLLLPTSEFARRSCALVAMNGGFFNVSNGGSVTYMEKNSQLVAKRSYTFTVQNTSPTFNGAIVIDQNGRIQVEQAQSPASYLASDQESAVMITGPVLIANGKPATLPAGSFSDRRHPRSCLGMTDTHLMFIAIDGRNQQASGMTLHELQKWMMELGCLDAVNLDGGGSTTLWIQSETHTGVINHPSDNGQFDQLGERPVANVIIIKMSREQL